MFYCKLSCGAPQAEFEQERARAEAANAAACAAAGLPATDAAAGPPPAQPADAGAKAGPSGSGELRNPARLHIDWPSMWPEERLSHCSDSHWSTRDFSQRVASCGMSSVHAGTASLGWGATSWPVCVAHGAARIGIGWHAVQGCLGNSTKPPQISGVGGNAGTARAANGGGAAARLSAADAALFEEDADDEDIDDEDIDDEELDALEASLAVKVGVA